MSPSIESAGAEAPKISIKGFSLSSKSSKPISSATKPKPSPTSTTLGKRPRAALHHDSDSEDDQDGRKGRHEVVTAFDANGAVTEQSKASGKAEVLVIPKMKNRDWREEIRRNKQRNGKNLLPPEVQAQRAGKGMSNGNAVDVVNAEGDEPQWGLTITKKTEEELHTTQTSDAKVQAVESTNAVMIEPPKERTEDEKAVDALMGIETERKKVELIIPVADLEEEQYDAPLTEEDAYRRAIRAAPDVSTLEDYERVPVEDFGAALLRGMGWKEGDTKKRPKEVKRRQNLLGLGATELQGAEELGAWVQQSDTKRLNSGGSKRPVERRPKANEYREREDKKKESRDERYGSHRRDRDDHRHRDSDRGRDRRR